MADIEFVLIGNAKEYTKNALEAYKRREFNTAVTLLFKAISALSDLYIFKNEGRTPSSHKDRFRILESKYPAIYGIIDKDFPFYQDSYKAKLDKETSDIPV